MNNKTEDKQNKKDEPSDVAQSTVVAATAATNKANGKAESESRPSNKKKPAGSTAHAKQGLKKSGNVFAMTLLVFLCVSATVIAGYDYWLLQLQAPVNAQLASSQSDLQSRFSELQQQLQKTQNQLSAEVQARESAQAEHQALNATLQAINERLGRSTMSWHMAEVEYLLTVANHRLTLAQDRRTAIAIFEAADSRLQAIGDPALLKVRKKIADELTALRAMADIDIPGLALQIGSLAEAVDQLPLIDKKRLAVAAEDKTDSTLTNWRELPATVWKDIKSLVQVRRHQQPTEPLLPPKQAWFLYQNLQLKLEQARLAVLQHNTELFRQSLDEAAQWLKSYYDGESAAVNNMQQTLLTLRKSELQPAVPDVSGSLRELRSVMRLYGQNSATPNPAGKTANSKETTAK